MFICNIKLNMKKVLFIFFLILVFIAGFTTYKILSLSTFKVNDMSNQNVSLTVNTDNFTDTLNLVYDNMNSYSGTKIKISGYIYRNEDFANDQFVVARTMQTPNDGDFIVRFFMFI